MNFKKSLKKHWKLLVAAAVLLAGIALLTFGCASAPPSALEQRFFTISNPPPVIEIKTNIFLVNVTKTNEVVVPITNLQNVVEYRTNVIVQTVTVPQTNVEVAVTPGGQILRPNEAAQQFIQTASGTVGTFNPLVGGMVGTALTAFFSIWGWLRSSKRYVNTAGELVHNVELLRNFIKTLPDGQTYDQLLLKYIVDHQREAGVVTNIMTLVENASQNADAQLAAQTIRNTLVALNAQTPPPPSPLPGTAPVARM